MIVDETLAQEWIQDLTIASWIVFEEENLTKINLGIKDNDALLTPWRTQMWVQVKDSGRRRSQDALPSSQHFEG
jgi:hypothetical protein